MVDAPVLLTVTDWYCPNCGATDQTREPRPHMRYHTCPKLRYLSAPFVKAGTKAKVEANDREDYEGPDAGKTRLDASGRPVMNIVRTRDDGTDTWVFAPTATATLGVAGSKPLRRGLRPKKLHRGGTG